MIRTLLRVAAGLLAPVDPAVPRPAEQVLVEAEAAEEVWPADDELRQCTNCDEPAGFLSSRDWCDSCEETGDVPAEVSTATPDPSAGPDRPLSELLTRAADRLAYWGQLDLAPELRQAAAFMRGIEQDTK